MGLADEAAIETSGSHGRGGRLPRATRILPGAQALFAGGSLRSDQAGNDPAGSGTGDWGSAGWYARNPPMPPSMSPEVGDVKETGLPYSSLVMPKLAKRLHCKFGLGTSTALPSTTTARLSAVTCVSFVAGGGLRMLTGWKRCWGYDPEQESGQPKPVHWFVSFEVAGTAHEGLSAPPAVRLRVDRKGHGS